MRDTRESRLLLVLLVAIAFALITVDIRGGEESPFDGARSAAASVFGPAQESVSSAVDPIGDAIAAVRESDDRAGRVAELERENTELKQRLSGDAADRRRVAELDKLLGTAGAGRYTIKAAQIVGIGAAQGFSWTVTIDIGSRDGITKDMTVLNGDGLVGRVSTVGPSTATVVLANDPDFTVGTRLERTSELGFATGQGDRPLRVQLINAQAKVEKGDRLVTFGSQGGKPFVPGVPVGKVTHVEPAAGNLTRTIQVEPFVSFTKLDLVGVVVEAPREDPRDSVLPPKPKRESAQKQDKQDERDQQDKQADGNTGQEQSTNGTGTTAGQNTSTGQSTTGQNTSTAQNTAAGQNTATGQGTGTGGQPPATGGGATTAAVTSGTGTGATSTRRG